MELLAEQHDVRREDEIETAPLAPCEPVEQGRPLVIPARQKGVEMGIVQDDRPIIGKRPPLLLPVDGIELGIAHDPQSLGLRGAARDKLARGLLTAHQYAVEPPLARVEGDRPVARAMWHMDEPGGTRPSPRAAAGAGRSARR